MNVADSLEWGKVYWVDGGKHAAVAAGMDPANADYAVKDPPCAGWGHAFLVRGAKRSTIFCPYTLASYQVPNDCKEVRGFREPDQPFRRDWAVEQVTRKWALYEGLDLPADLDMAAMVLQRLGAPVPVAKPRPEGEARQSTGGGGGKPVADEVTKPIDPKGKRGQVAAWFLADGAGKPRSIREAMAKFDSTRSNILSVLFLLNRDHGLGYSLGGDTAAVHVPTKGEVFAQTEEKKDAQPGKGPKAAERKAAKPDERAGASGDGAEPRRAKPEREHKAPRDAGGRPAREAAADRKPGAAPSGAGRVEGPGGGGKKARLKPKRKLKDMLA